MKANYDPVADVLCLLFSDAAVVRKVLDGRNISIGYSDDGQPVEITILEASKLLSERTDGDDPPLVLTASESYQLAESIDNPPPPNDALLRAMARRRELLREDVFSAGTDTLAEYSEAPLRHQMSDLHAIVRRIMIDLRLLDLEPDNATRIDQLTRP